MLGFMHCQTWVNEVSQHQLITCWKQSVHVSMQSKCDRCDAAITKYFPQGSRSLAIWAVLMLLHGGAGREHLYFYGRLKGLPERALKDAVDAALQSVNLFSGGVGNKRVSAYSGGMKRRLSVAISLIGDPKVLYVHEPSTVRGPEEEPDTAISWGCEKV